VVHLDVDRDFAILEGFISRNYVRLCFDPVREGELVATYGYRMMEVSVGRFLSRGMVSSGIVTKIQRGLDVEVLQTSIESNPGNSGGPVFLQRSGEVIAVQHGRVYREGSDELVPGQSLAISVGSLKDVLLSLGVMK